MRQSTIAFVVALYATLSIPVIDAIALPIESIWGQESSTSAKKAGQPAPELDGYLDSDRLLESAGANAEQQGVYREMLKSEPVCYDPLRPERMPWYVERQYETITTTILDSSMSIGGTIASGEQIVVHANFSAGTVEAIPPSCGHWYQFEGPTFAIPYDTVCNPNVVFESWLESTSQWIAAGNPDMTYSHRVIQLPSCDNGLIGLFHVWDTTPGCEENSWGLGQRWRVRLKAEKTELVDVTPPHSECFYP